MIRILKSKSEKCCSYEKGNGRNILKGIVYGLFPHIFCLAFIIFSLIGSAAAVGYLKNFLVLPYFFPALILFSLVFATLSAIVYLKRKGCLCLAGIKNERKYLLTLYSSIVVANIFLFFVVFPAATNYQGRQSPTYAGQSADLQLEVGIPCTGHASLIVDELKKDQDVLSVEFSAPQTFEVRYDPKNTTPEKIVALEIFKQFEVKIL